MRRRWIGILALLVSLAAVAVVPALALNAPGGVQKLPPPAQITATPVTPTLTPTLAEVYAVVITPRLNVRSGPGVNYDIVGTIPRGERLRLIGTNDDASWHVIEFEGEERWISGFVQSVRIEGDPELLPVYEPPPTPTPTATLTPSITPVGVFAQVISSFLNVRAGPGTVYPIIGRLNRNERVELIGANTDFTYYVIIFRQRQAWISGDRTLLRIISGDRRTLPLVEPPPTPTPRPTRTPTFTPTPEPFPDIVLVTANLVPPIPAPGQPFTLQVTIRNQGGLNAGEFAVATAFDPGQVYSAQIVPGLAVGAQTTVNLTGTVTGTGNFTIAIVLDLNAQVDEGPLGEENNKPNFSYKIDRPYIASGTNQIAPVTSVDLGSGGTQDISWDGTNLSPINGTLFALLTVPLNAVHWDYLSPALVSSGAPIPIGSLPPGTLVGIKAAEGNRGVLRVVGYNGANIILEYYIYAP